MRPRSGKLRRLASHGATCRSFVAILSDINGYQTTASGVLCGLGHGWFVSYGEC